MCDPLPGHQHIKGGVLLDVVHGLLVSHHGEIVAVQLEDLVVDPQPYITMYTYLTNLTARDLVSI